MILAAGVCSGQTLYWDINGATAGAGGPSPAGTWDGTTQNWNVSSAGTNSTTTWVSGDTAVFSADSDATGVYTVTLSGPQTASGVAFATGTATLTGGTLTLTAPATVTVNAAPTKGVIVSSIGGSVGLTKQNSGELVLAGANTFNGNLTNLNGVLTLNNSAAASSGTIVLSPASSTSTSTLTSSNAAITIANNISLGGLTAGSIQVAALANSVLTLGGVVSGTHNWSVNGPGTVVLAGATANTFTSGLTVQAGATVDVITDGALGSSGNGTLVNAGGTLALGDGVVFTTHPSVTLNGTGMGGLGALQGVSGVNEFDFAGALSLGSDTTVGAAANSELSINTPINSSGTANLTITNIGIVALTGLNNNYSNTIVGSGILEVDSPANAGNALVTINAGAILTGDGSAPGTVNVSGIIAPNGEFSSGAENWNNDGAYVWEITDANNPGANDLLAISGGLAINANSGHPFTVAIVSLNPNTGQPGTPANFDNGQQYQWVIASTASGITGFSSSVLHIDASHFVPAIGGGSFRLLVSGNDLVLEFDPAPVIYCPNPIVQGNDLNNCSATVSFAAVATNYPNISPVTISYQTNSTTITSPHVFPEGTTVVNATATDAVGNTATCSFTVTVNDTQPPTIITKSASKTLDANGNATIAVADVNNGTYDNCSGIIGLLISKNATGPWSATLSYGCSDTGAHTVYLQATDVANNAAVGSAPVTISDTTVPTAVAKNISVNLSATSPGTVTVSGTDIDNGSSDNCSIAQYLISGDGGTTFASSVTFGCGKTGSQPVILKVVDPSGNASTAPATVTVNDVTPPTAVAKNIDVDLGASSPGAVTVAATAIDNGSSDNCSIDHYLISKDGGATYSSSVSFACGDTGAQSVILKVVDPAGLSSTAPATVTVHDVTAPTVVFNTITVQLDSTGNYTLSPSDITTISAGSSDNCSVASVVVVPGTLTFCDVGNKSVALIVTDASGNSATNHGSLTVNAPVAAPTVVYVDPSYTGCFSVNGGYVGYNSFSSVQSAINAVASGGTVNVAAGTYAENVTANKPVTLLGANQGVAGCGSRGGESIVGGGGNALTIASAGVTVDGFELNGVESVVDYGYTNVVIQNNVLNAVAVGADIRNIAPAAGTGFTLQNNCITLAGQLAAGNPTVGIGLNTVSGTQSPLIQGNNVQGASYGYLLYGLNASVPVAVSGGSVSGVLQGVTVLNINPLTLADYNSSVFGVSGISMSGFSGGNANTPQAGVYVYTGGGNLAATVTGTVSNVSVTGVGNVSSDSAGMDFADFSSGLGTRQNITVTGCNVFNNANRGIFCSGTNQVTAINQSTISGNGYNPYGTGGNYGYGVIARVRAQVTVSQCVIANPAVQTASSVRALEADANVSSQGPTLVVNDSSVVNNGNGSGLLAEQDAGTLNASGNYWGTTSDTAIAGLMSGVVDFTPYLDSGVDTDAVTPGFQGDFSSLHVTMLGAQTGNTGRVQEGINSIADGSLTGGSRLLSVQPGTYSEAQAGVFGITIDRALTLFGTGGPSVTTINSTDMYMVYVASANVTLSGLSVTDPTYSTGGWGGDGSAIWIGGDGVTGILITNCAIHDLGERPYGVNAGPDGSLEVAGSSFFNIHGYPLSEEQPIAVVDDGGSYADQAVGIFVWEWSAATDGINIHDNTIYSLDGRPHSAGITVGGAQHATVNENQLTLGGAVADGIVIRASMQAGLALVTSNTISGGQYGIELRSPSSQSVGNNNISNAGASVFVNNSSATITHNSASTGSGVGIWASGSSAKALVENNTLVGDSEAAIKADGGATVDAGDCTGGDVTGLGTGSGPGGSSAGGNLMTGYGFDGVAPWAVENLNSSGPVVLAYQNSYGAVVGNNLASLFAGDVAGDQSGGLLVQYPANQNLQCSSSVPAGANSLAAFVAQGGAVSAVPVVISFNDTGVTNDANSFVINRSYSLADACSETGSATQTITVNDTLPPVVTTWPASRTLDVGGQCNVAVPDLTVEVVGAADNCGDIHISQYPAANSYVSLGVTNVLVVVADDNGNAISNSVTLTVIDTSPAPTATFVDANYANLPAGTVVTFPFNGGTGTHYVGCDAFGTIQSAIGRVATGGTVNVAAGLYAENVLLNKSAALLGPNAAIDPNTGSRAAEAVIVPGAVETSVQGSTSGVLIRVGNGTSHVDATIEGFTLDGHNASLSGGLTLNGVEIDTGAGIVNSTGSFDANPGSYDTTMVVQNNIIRNLERYGVLADSVLTGTPSAGNDVSHNQIDNLPAGNNFPGGGRGRGVAFEDNTYGTCSYNVMTRVNVGWQDDNYWLASPGAGTLVASNSISTYHRGIFHNLQYESATAAVIEGNNIQVETHGDHPASSSNFGIELASIQSAVDESVVGNNVTNNIYGILLWNVTSTGNVTVSGGHGLQQSNWSVGHQPGSAIWAGGGQPERDQQRDGR